MKVLAQKELGALDWLQEVSLFADPVRALERVTGGVADEWQKELLHCQEAFTLVLASRGIGKSTTVAVDAFLFAENNPNTTTLIIAPVARQAIELFRSVKIVRNKLIISAEEARGTQVDMDFQNGSRIVVLPGDSDRIRAFRAHRIYLDESARLPDGGWAAILPMLFESGRLIAITTPKGRQGFFYEAWTDKRGYNIMAKSTELPRMEKIVARDKKFMTTGQFRTEHELQFAGSGDPFFDWDDVQNAITQDPALSLSCLRI